MRELSLPGGKPFRRRLELLAIGLSALAVVLISLYLMALLRLPSAHWWGFVQLVVGVFGLLTFVAMRTHQRASAALIECLERRAAGSADAGVLRAGFAAASDLPRRTFLQGCLWWTAGSLAVVLGMTLRFSGFGVFAASVMLAAAFSGGLMATIFHTFLLRRLLEPVRMELARELRDPDERRALVHPVPLGTKLRVAMMGVTLVTLVFAVFLAVVLGRRPTEELAARVQRGFLEQAAQTLAQQGSAALPGLEAQARALGIAQDLLWLDAAAARVEAGRDGVLTADDLALLRGAGAGRSHSARVDGAHVFSWVALPSRDGWVVAVAPWRQLAGDPSALQAIFAGLLVFSVLAALALASLVADEVSHATRALGLEVDRVAAGDLTPGSVFESEDELGDLARSFQRMAGALRATLARVSGSADRVESAAGEISSVSESVASVTADQVRGIEQVAVSMESIDAQITGITESAQMLGISVEESSSSILELGAAGEQLNQTASVLSSKVGEVSVSIEQMIRSVRQAGRHAESLTAAAAETSSSMEEMASSMREVDANASEMARLSSAVISSAESGRDRVRQTIEGMDAIREATETAERVIRSLGERTKEIGAIVDVIDDVADETNLLALNAAIIAAQAGEHGRAFSVVADQIKDLADRVLTSTKEIGGLIRALQAESANAIGAIERGAYSVKGGVHLSAEAGASLEEITRASRESGERIAEIVSAVREQSRAASHVVELMESVRGGVEQIRAAGKEQERGNDVVLRNSVAMREVAQQVRGTTEEQARGSGRIRESIESVREVVERVHRSLQQQSAACRAAVESLARVQTRTRSNEESAQRMGRAMRELRREAEALREDVQRFKI